MSTRNDLVAQLNALLRLTQTETTVTEARRTQATTEPIERELARSVQSARDRAELLGKALRDLDAVPDVVGAATGRLAGSVKVSVDRGMTLTDALLGDLALEHELLSRARLAKMMAERLGETSTVKALDRIEAAHTATIDWLMTRLGEIAIDAPPSLRPTAVQAVAGFGRRLTALPATQAAQILNRGVDLTARIGRRTAEAISVNADRSRQLLDAAGEIWTAGRDAALKRSEETAAQQGARRTAREVNQVRRELGALSADELPIRNYDSLSAADAVSRIGRLRDPDAARAVFAYEAAHKQRKSVTGAAQQRLQELAADLAAAS
jgi:bacterioferritin (cytochrome b1)